MPKHTILTSFIVSVLCFGIYTTQAQTYTDESPEIVTEDEEIEEVAQVLSSFDLLGISSEPNLRNQAIQGNLVSLRQIGDFNQVAVTVNANASDIAVNQFGQNNNTILEYEVNTAVSNLTQFGNNNRIRDYVIQRNENISLDLTQEGNNLYFERFGSNSLTESLQLKQTEASPTIIIRSFQ